MPLGWISPGMLHDVLITGLKPQTLYQYQVGTGGVVRTDWQRFVSAPSVGATTSVDFLMYGDMGVKTPFEHTPFWRQSGVDQQESSVGTLPLLKRYAHEGIPGYNATVDLAAAVHRRLTKRFGAPMTSSVTQSRLILHIGDISYARYAKLFSRCCCCLVFDLSDGASVVLRRFGNILWIRSSRLRRLCRTWSPSATS
jgi:hypothetical protein